jgi:thymidylate synthase (FAD)
MSEFSRRYITDDIEFYEPDYWRKAAPDKKQGSLEEPVDLGEFNSDGDAFSGYFGEGTLAEMVRYHKTDSIEVFNALLKAGVAPEQARKELPQDLMTEWTWSGTLGAFAKMCQLRLHPEAQYEARLVAQQVYEYLKQYYPVSAKALVEGPDV